MILIHRILIVLLSPFLVVVVTNHRVTSTQSTLKQQSFTRICFLDSTILIAVGRGPGILRSADGGRTWRAIDTRVEFGLNGIAFATNEVGFAVGHGVVLRTNDGGTSWRILLNGEFDLTDVHCLSRDTLIAIGYHGLIVRSTNGGYRWSAQYSETMEPLNDITFSDHLNGFVVGNHGTILRTDDGGITWAKQESGTSAWLWRASSTSPNTCTAVGSEGVILRTNDGGFTWRKQAAQTIKHFFSTSFADSAVGVAVGHSGQIFTTSDAGNSWYHQASPTSTGLNDVKLYDRQVGFAVGLVLLRTDDGGKNWIRVRSPMTEEY